MSGGCSVRMSAEMRRPRALDALGYECPRRPEEERKSSSVRLAILAEASRVGCAALRDRNAKQGLPKEERKRKFAGVSNCQRDKHCDGGGLLDQVVAECNAILRCSVSRAVSLRH